MPIVALGHSLGGHVTLAAQGTGRVGFDAIVGVGANVWLRELEPSHVRWLVKRASLTAAVALSRRAGRFPARALGAGSDDESLDFFEDFERFSRSGWRSRDGREDYWAALARVRCRALQLVSEGDRWVCAPECGERFIARCGGETRVERIGRGDDEGPPPTHMGMVTSGRVVGVWRRMEGWMRASKPN
jgi:predicted alpha/beta hydrolase